METLPSVQSTICDEKCKHLEQMKEIVHINYIKADTDFLNVGVKGSLNYFYQTIVIKALQKPTITMIIIIIVMMPTTRMIIRTMQPRSTLIYIE